MRDVIAAVHDVGRHFSARESAPVGASWPILRLAHEMVEDGDVVRVVELGGRVWE